MKRIHKRTILATLVGALCALTLTFGAVALAHGGPYGKGGPTGAQMDALLEEMVERLDLSAAQERRIRTIAEDAKTEAQQIRQMPSGKEKLLAFRDLHFATEDRIHANLTCEQREELRLLKREHKAERMEQRFERHQQIHDSKR
jgi:Spy/CpxP family protein refolding chaperone